MNVNLTDPTPRREGCVPFCAEPYGGDHEPDCQHAQDVARVEAMLTSIPVTESELRLLDGNR